MQEVITVFVRVEQAFSVQGQAGSATMLLFSGYAQGENFNGKILPGAVDCQKTGAEGFTLSARYILEGEDGAGKSCKLFIENNGTADEAGVIHTKPLVYTDSDCLKWLETVPLTGHISEQDGVLVIHICAEKGEEIAV